MKSFKIIVVVLISIVVTLQVVPSKLPKTTSDNASDLISNNAINDTISSMLKNACYDCHSNETVYPWYSHVAPVSWLVIHDIREGRKNLNFSYWESLTLKQKLKLLSKTADVITEGKMPFPPYMLIHKESRLSDNDRKKLIAWTETFGDYLFERATAK